MFRKPFAVVLLGGMLALAAGAAAPSLRDVATPAEVRRTPARGDFLVLNIWATWCVPCVHEMEDLRKLDAQFRAKGVEFVGVSLDDVIPGERAKSRQKVVKFLATKSIAYGNLYYTGKQNALADAFDFEGEIPVTLVFDRKGKEVFRVNGIIDRQQFAGRLEKLVSKRKDGKT